MKTKIEGLVLCCIKVVSNIVTLGLRSKGNIYVSICTSNKSRHNEQLKEHGNWTEKKITYFLSVGLSLFSIVPVKEKDYIYEKWHIWKIESEPYFTVVGTKVALSAAILDKWNHDRNHNVWNIGSTEAYILHIQNMSS